MAKVNNSYRRLKANYLFFEVVQRTKQFQAAHPGVQIHKLGTGNTTEPLPPTVLAGLHLGVEKLGNKKTYTGYRDELGDIRLRQAIVNMYSRRNVDLDFEEVFISDGAKPDTANIQSLFSLKSIIALQDPVYPVYLDSNVITGRTGMYHNGSYKGVVYLPCTKENNFIPPLPQRHVDLIYLCSPHNPTGAVMNKQQLKRFVDYAQEHKAVIIFDAAYAAYISDAKLPRSIFEIEGAKNCAIEINSFSKSAGFTGVRLGWTIVPKDLVVEDARKGEIHAMWRRRQTTMFNGASNIVQEGGLAVLSKQGLEECLKIVSYYMGNARLIRKTLLELGFEVFGGDNAPYLWVKTPQNMTSWEFFDMLLEKAHVVVTPGSGFGPHGEGYVRMAAFGHREDIEKAVTSLKNI